MQKACGALDPLEIKLMCDVHKRRRGRADLTALSVLSYFLDQGHCGIDVYCMDLN